MDRSGNPGVSQEKVDPFFAEAQPIPIGGNQLKPMRPFCLSGLPPKRPQQFLRASGPRWMTISPAADWPPLTRVRQTP